MTGDGREMKLDLLAHDPNILEWAVIQHNSSLIGKGEPMPYAIEGLGDLLSLSFNWGGGDTENIITTVWSRGHSSYAEAARACKSVLATKNWR